MDRKQRWRSTSLGLVATAVVVTATLLAAFPTPNQLLRLASSEQATKLSIDEFGFVVYMLAVKSIMGSDESLMLLINASENVDGGFTISQAGAVRLCWKWTSDNRFQQALSKASSESSRRTLMIIGNGG